MHRHAEKWISNLVDFHDKPIIYRGENFYIAGFGLFAAIATFVGLCVFTSFIAVRGVTLHYPEEAWAAVIVLSMAIFSKLLHPIVIGKDYFKNPLHYLKQTAFYNQGGQIGVLFGIILMGWVEHVDILLLLDAVCYTYCMGLIIARLGCYNYGCCYGKITQSRFSIAYHNPETKILRLHPELANISVIPTQLYESAFCVLLFIMMTILFSYDVKQGIAAFAFIILYNGFRLYIHRYRANDDVIKVGTGAQDKHVFFWIATMFFVFGCTWLIITLLFAHPLAHVNTESMSIYVFFAVNFSSITHLISMLIISVIILFIYGYHHKELGRHF